MVWKPYNSDWVFVCTPKLGLRCHMERRFWFEIVSHYPPCKCFSSMITIELYYIICDMWPGIRATSIWMKSSASILIDADLGGQLFFRIFTRYLEVGIDFVKDHQVPAQLVYTPPSSVGEISWNPLKYPEIHWRHLSTSMFRHPTRNQLRYSCKN